MSTLSKKKLLDMYYHMILIRRFEEKCADLYQQGKIGGFLHLYIGEEATGVGAVHAMSDEDHVITAYRDHGIALARGLSAKACMAELLGKSTGVSGGRGGSMHFASRARNFWGGYGIVGGHLPLAAGIALRARYNKEDYAVVAFMGDGSTNIGYFHESLNLSAVWDLPVVWIIENNQYGMGTAVSRASGQEDLSKRAIAYGMKEWKRVDGNNVIDVFTEVEKAIEYARKTGPVLMECVTYRYRGHSMGDPERYRTAAEIDEHRAEDPIQRFRNYLIDKRKANTKELDELDNTAFEEIEEAVEFAEASPEPGFETLYDDIYATDTERKTW